MNEQLKEIIEYLKTEPSVDAVEKKIKEDLSDMPTELNHINQTYYQYDEDTIYVENSNGIAFTIGKGLGDIYGNLHSNEGVNLTATFLDEKYYLYEQNEIQTEEINQFESNIINTNDKEILACLENANMNPLLFMTFDQNIRNNPEFIKACLDNLWREASALHRQQVSDASISLMDGYDVKQLTVEENYLNLMDNFSDEEFKLKGYQYLLSQEGSQEFIEKSVTDLQTQIEFVENRDLYAKINDLLVEKENILHFQKHDITAIHSDLLNEIESIDTEIEKIKLENNINYDFSVSYVKGMAAENLFGLDTVDSFEYAMKYYDKNLVSNKEKLNKLNSVINAQNHEMVDYYEKYNYQLLSRLQQDCEYYLGNGNHHPKHLWAGNEIEQIEKMKELYNAIPNEKKPEWISMEDIENYEKQMCQYTMPKVDMQTNISCYSSDPVGVKENIHTLNETITQYYQNHHEIPKISVSLSINNQKLFEELILDSKAIQEQLKNKEVNVLEVLKNSVSDHKQMEQLDILEEQLELIDQIDFTQNMSFSM